MTPPTERCLFEVVPEDLFEEILVYLEAWDLVRLADTNLNCQFGEFALKVRTIFRRRRVIILSTHWLELGDLGSLVAAYLSVDPIISRKAHNYIDNLIKSSRTTDRRNRLATITNLEAPNT